MKWLVLFFMVWVSFSNQILAVSLVKGSYNAIAYRLTLEFSTHPGLIGKSSSSTILESNLGQAIQWLEKTYPNDKEFQQWALGKLMGKFFDTWREPMKIAHKEKFHNTPIPHFKKVLAKRRAMTASKKTSMIPERDLIEAFSEACKRGIMGECLPEVRGPLAGAMIKFFTFGNTKVTAEEVMAEVFNHTHKQSKTNKTAFKHYRDSFIPKALGDDLSNSRLYD